MNLHRVSEKSGAFIGRPVLLVRHGSAESFSAEGDDYHRRLTPEGKERLEQRFPDLVERMTATCPREHWLVCSSPRLRARETALCLAAALDDCGYLALPDPRLDFATSPDYPGIQILDELDGADPIELLLALDVQTSGAVCLVGHQPFMSYWTAALTGKNIEFKKGDAALLDLHPGGHRSALMWHEQMKNR
jgi:phosphohistidine phosphatase SixA